MHSFAIRSLLPVLGAALICAAPGAASADQERVCGAQAPASELGQALHRLEDFTVDTMPRPAGESEALPSASWEVPSELCAAAPRGATTTQTNAGMRVAETDGRQAFVSDPGVRDVQAVRTTPFGRSRTHNVAQLHLVVEFELRRRFSGPSRAHRILRFERNAIDIRQEADGALTLRVETTAPDESASRATYEMSGPLASDEWHRVRVDLDAVEDHVAVQVGDAPPRVVRATDAAPAEFAIATETAVQLGDLTPGLVPVEYAFDGVAVWSVPTLHDDSLWRTKVTGADRLLFDGADTRADELRSQLGPPIDAETRWHPCALTHGTKLGPGEATLPGDNSGTPRCGVPTFVTGAFTPAVYVVPSDDRAVNAPVALYQGERCTQDSCCLAAGIPAPSTDCNTYRKQAAFIPRPPEDWPSVYYTGSLIPSAFWLLRTVVGDTATPLTPDLGLEPEGVRVPLESSGDVAVADPAGLDAQGIASDTDAPVAFVQPGARDALSGAVKPRAWEFWKFVPEPHPVVHAGTAITGMSAQWGGRMHDTSRPNPSGSFGGSAPGATPELTEDPTWGATATSLPLFGGLVTLSDLRAGKIEHAVGLAVPRASAVPVSADGRTVLKPRDGGALQVWPARRTDGKDLDRRYDGLPGCYQETNADGEALSAGDASGCIPAGSRFRIAADHPCSATSFGGDAASPSRMVEVAMMLCEAGREYGFVVWDTSGGVDMRFERPRGDDNPYKPGGVWEAGLLGGRPVDAARTFWDGVMDDLETVAVGSDACPLPGERC